MAGLTVLDAAEERAAALAALVAAPWRGRFGGGLARSLAGPAGDRNPAPRRRRRGPGRAVAAADPNPAARAAGGLHVAGAPQSWLLDQAVRRGSKTVYGLSVFIEQVAVAMQRWTGVDPSRPILRDAAEDFGALREKGRGALRAQSAASLTLRVSMERLDVTGQTAGWLDLMRAGDQTARLRLIEHSCERLRNLARKMLRRYPKVRRWEETDDVFVEAVTRLDRALATVEIQSPRHFYNLAATHIRRVLIDLARRYYGSEGLGRHHDTTAGNPGEDAPPRYEPADASGEPASLMEWTEFHEAVGRLPADEQEVFNLLWYEQLTHEQAAEVLGVTARTVRRRWQDAVPAVQGAPGRIPAGGTIMTGNDRFRDLLDRWEELREQGREPSVEELCRDDPHLAAQLRDWTTVLKRSDWLKQRADDVADETFGDDGGLTGGERGEHRVIGEYLLLEELFSGGMGRVFKAIHRKLNRTVALKLLPESRAESPESVERFRREVQALARLAHPNIVAVHDAGAADGVHFYVMDLVEGEDLARLVREHGPLPVEQALDCVLQAARGLDYAHAQGVVHRDVKPSNLILDGNGTLKILDLGIARFQGLPEQAGDDLTKTGCVLGTVDYMAPEQAMNTRRADHRADIYSLGCTLHFLLTGKPVFGGETVMERLVAHREHAAPSLRRECPSAPKWLDGVFAKMVAKRPEDRYQSVAELVSDLSQRSSPRHGRRRWLAAGAVVLGAVATAVILMLSPTAFRHGPPPQSSPQKGLDLTVKPAWRTTNDYPLIAGVWSIVDAEGGEVSIVQHDGSFLARASYQEGGKQVSWRAEGRIGHSGHIVMNLVYQYPQGADQRPPESRTAVLGLQGGSLEGYAASGGGHRKFHWKLLEPRDAERQELPR